MREVKRENCHLINSDENEYFTKRWDKWKRHMHEKFEIGGLHYYHSTSILSYVFFPIPIRTSQP